MLKNFLIADFAQFGGTRTYLKTILDFYTNMHFDVVVGLISTEVDEEIEGLIKSYGFTSYRIRERPTYLRRIWFRFPFSIIFDIFVILHILIKEKVNCITVSTGTPGNFLGLALLPIKFLYILHTYPMQKMNKLYRLLLNHILNNKKKIITVSETAKKHIINFWFDGIDRKTVEVIYNSAGRELITKVKNEEPTCRILTLGHVTAYKNPKLWVDVAYQVISKTQGLAVEFIWAGDGDMLEECRELVKKLDCKNIKFVGYQRDVASLYVKSMIYFQPSLIESQGLSVLDAMRYALPCIVSNVGGLPESVANGDTGFVIDVNNDVEFVEKIILLLLDCNLRMEMGNFALERYREFFSAEIWKQKMLNLYS